jgi:hypothetical protein
MMNRTLRTSIFATAVGLCGLVGTAASDPGVVVLSFEGEMNLAVAARAEVVSLVDRDYEVVTQRAWREALENDGRKGRAAWAQASKATKVAAVIEGTASRAGKGGTLTLVVKDARTGRTIESLSAPLGKHGLTDKARAELEISLVDALFVSTDAEDEEGAERTRSRDGEELAAHDETSSRRPRVAADVKVGVAASQQTEPSRLALFEAPKNDGSAAPTIEAAPRLPRVPIAGISLTGAAMSRQFGFTGVDLPADYPGATVTSIGLQAAIYPTSKRDEHNRLNGLGVAAAIRTSVASEVPVDLDGEVFDFPVSQDYWQINAHYRYPAGIALIDGHVGYASLTHYVEDIPQDAALELDLLDAEYGYLDFGARIEVEAGPRTTLGFSASYLHMLQVGVVTDPDLLGNAQSWGMQAGLDLKIQLGAGMFAQAGADYRRVSMVFDGDGELYQDVDVDDAKDTFIGGRLELGVLF